MSNWKFIEVTIVDRKTYHLFSFTRLEYNTK